MVADEIRPVTIEFVTTLFFCDEVVVIKIIISEVNSVVMPKREVCLMGLSQSDDVILATERTTRGRNEGDAVKVSLPRVRLLIHQAIKERLARMPMK
mgnify:CR=1 FL=1